ncbi:MAG: hypothetical protein ACOX2F_03245 [bacterium]
MNSSKTIRGFAVFVVIAMLSSALYYFYGELSLLKKKSETNAKEIELLKLEIGKKEEQSSVGSEKSSRHNDLLSLQNKVVEMKREFEKIKQNNSLNELETYKTREERVWDNHAESAKILWSASLKSELVNRNFNSVEIEDILYNYREMLDKTKNSLLDYYRGEMPEEDVNQVSVSYARDFYDSISSLVGEQKASIALAVIFPDTAFRKSLFERE